MVRRVDLEDIERVGRGNAEALALADGEVVDAGVASDDFAGGGDEFARRIGDGFALLLKISVDELLVVASGDEANLLRVRLGGQGKVVLRRDLANLRLLVATKRKERARKLLLRKAKQEVGLVLRRVRGPLQDPAVARRS